MNTLRLDRMQLARRSDKNSLAPLPIRRTSSRSLGLNDYLVLSRHWFWIDNPGYSDLCAHVRRLQYLGRFDRLELCYRPIRIGIDLRQVSRTFWRAASSRLWPLDGLNLHLDGRLGAKLRPAPLLPLCGRFRFFDVLSLCRRIDSARCQR